MSLPYDLSDGRIDWSSLERDTRVDPDRYVGPDGRLDWSSIEEEAISYAPTPTCAVLTCYHPSQERHRGFCSDHAELAANRSLRPSRPWGLT